MTSNNNKQQKTTQKAKDRQTRTH